VIIFSSDFTLVDSQLTFFNRSAAGPSGREVLGVGLWPLTCWDKQDKQRLVFHFTLELLLTGRGFSVNSVALLGFRELK
jgi:hypothetical protein